MTANQCGEYNSFCGILFCFSNDYYADLYRDDNPADNSSVKAYPSKRYRRSYRCEAVADTYFGNQWAVEDFKLRFPQFHSQDTLQSAEEQVAMEGGCRR